MDDVALLLKGIMFLDADAARVIFDFYARDRHAPSPRVGVGALRAILQAFPDHKAIEDAHHPLLWTRALTLTKSCNERQVRFTGLMFYRTLDKIVKPRWENTGASVTNWRPTGSPHCGLAWFLYAKIRPMTSLDLLHHENIVDLPD